MPTTLRDALATVVVLLTAGSMLGCLGIHDLTPPNGTDASDAAASNDPTTANNDDATTNTNDDATIDSNGATTVPDGSGGHACMSGAPCAPADCQTGTFACAGGSGKCNKTGNVPDGTPCGSAPGSVCHAGTCGTCAAGADCTDMANPCVKKTNDCSSGQAVCKPAMNAPDGTACGTGLFCNGGACSACAVGNACSPASNACHTGKVTACTGGAITCTDQGAPAPAGASCQTTTTPSGVCDGNGNCAACATSAACNPAGNPCQQGAMTCTMGPVCGSPKNINEGKACGAGQICSAGACVACSATSCASGCCDSTGCVTSAQTGSNCGTKGAACAPCAGGQVCTMGGGGCSCPPAASTSCSGTCVNVQTDPKNCGACANDCTTKPHVMGPATCSAGVCSVPGPSCAPGWAHCTTNPADICETDLSQMTHCGGCGNVCPAATPVCAKGASGASGCVTGCTPPAMTICAGTCTDSSTDAKNCGGCGTVCPAQTCTNGMLTAASTCSGGTCMAPPATACPGGYACNGTACLTNCTPPQTNCAPTTPYCIGAKCVAQKLNNGQTCGGDSDCMTGSHCVGGICCNAPCNGPCDSCTRPGMPAGICGPIAGKACTPAAMNASSGQCDANGNCAVTSCNPGFCAASPSNCVRWGLTSCGPNCDDCSKPLMGATMYCDTGAGKCVLVCNQGYADCDHIPTNGCEINTTNDFNNCGACNQSCNTCLAGVNAPYCLPGPAGLPDCASYPNPVCVCAQPVGMGPMCYAKGG